MKDRVPYGFDDDVEANKDGWPVWKKEKGCGSCSAKESSEEPGEPLFALTCPQCEAPGCDECFPMGRGCACPTCEEDGEDEDEW